MSSVHNSFLAAFKKKKGKPIPQEKIDYVVHKISTATTLEQLDDVEEFLYYSPKINRKLKKNRQTILELLSLKTKRAYEIIDEFDLVPF